MEISTSQSEHFVVPEGFKMENVVLALGKFEDTRICAEQLREGLPDDVTNPEQANDIVQVFKEYSAKLFPYLEGASRMIVAQRK